MLHEERYITFHCHSLPSVLSMKYTMLELSHYPPVLYTRVIKADLYRYYFTKLGSEESKRGQVWKRELLGSYWGVTNREGLLDAIRRAG